MQKNPRKRLGYTSDSVEIMNHGDIQLHTCNGLIIAAVFFRGLQWEKLLAKEIKPPYIPKIV